MGEGHQDQLPSFQVAAQSLGEFTEKYGCSLSSSIGTQDALPSPYCALHLAGVHKPGLEPSSSVSYLSGMALTLRTLQT